jgi:protoporphyrinogen/coproporphyrinogen III oxidase
MSVAVIGAGISGLSLAHELMARGREVAIFEASPQPGGKVGTRVRDGFTLEAGPNGFLDSEPATLELVAALGLEGRLRRASPASKRRFVLTRGVVREVPASPKLMFSSVLSVPGRLRLLLEPFTRRGKSEDESLASFMRRHLGREAADVLVDAVQSGIYAGDPERMSVAAVFPKLAAMDQQYGSLLVGMMRSRPSQSPPGSEAGGPHGSSPAAAPLSARRRGSELCSFDGGLGTLIAALAEQLGPRLRCSTRVTALGLEGAGWTLTLDESGRPGTFRARQVVLALPPTPAAALVRPLDQDAAAALSEIRSAPVAVVHLGYAPGTVVNRPQGFGFVVPYREGRPLLGILYVSSFFPWRAPDGAVLLTCMLGGVRHPEVLERDETGLAALAREQVRDTLGISVEPSLVDVVRWERAIPQYEIGHSARLERLERGLARLPGLFAIGQGYRGVGLNDCVRSARALATAMAAAP